MQQYKVPDGNGGMMIVERLADGTYQEVVAAAPVSNASPTVTALTPPRATKPEKPDKPRVQQVGGVLGIVGDDGSFTPTYTPPAKPKESGGSGVNLSPSVRKDALNGYQTAQALRQMADDLNGKFLAGPGSTSGIKGLTDYLPYTANQQFDAAANKARGIVGTALGFTGGQLNTQTEAEKAIGPYLPQSDDRDALITDKIATLHKLADDAEAKAVAVLGGQPDANGNITPVKSEQMDRGDRAVVDPNTSTGTTLSNGKTQAVDDPVLKRVGQNAGRMLSAGKPDKEIIKYLTDNGVPPDSTSIGAALKYRNTPEFKRWQQGHPGKPYPLGDQFYKKEVPLSMTRGLLNNAAQTGAGAGTVAFANGVSANQLANIVDATGGDGATARTGMGMLREQSPWTSLAGDIAGQAALEYGVGRIPGARGLLASPWGRRGADVLYGGVSGAGDDASLTGVLTGAAFNAGGGAAGRGVQRGAGGALTGVRDASLQYLNRAGVPLTVGQIARGTEGRLGRLVGGVEERLMGLPGPDAMIGGARHRGDVGFNRAAFRELGGTGATGAAGITEGQGLVNQAYGFLDNAQIPVDAPFAGSQAAVRAGIPNLPAYGREVGTTLDMIDQAAPNGVMPGRDWQSGIRQVRADRASIAGQPFAGRAGDALTDVEDNLVDLAARNGPANTMPQLAAANTTNARFQTLTRALDSSVAQRGGELFSPTGLDNAARQARNFGGRTASVQGNRPFYELTQAGMDAMPNLTPDSGSVGRLAILPALGAALGGAEGLVNGDDKLEDGGSGLLKGAILASVLQGMYSRPGQAILQSALLAERPRAVTQTGEWLARNANLSGRLGSGIARTGYYQNTP